MTETRTLNTILDAYIADRRNPFAYRKCKWPGSLEGNLREVRKLWGHLPYSEFCRGSKARTKDGVMAWRAAGSSPATCRKRISTLKTACRFAISEEIITRAEEPIIELPPGGPPRERYLDAATELGAHRLRRRPDPLSRYRGGRGSFEEAPRRQADGC